jgi:hypothetical protein
MAPDPIDSGLSLASWLFAASASTIGTLGVLHLVFTFYGPKLHPRDAGLETAMRQVSPVISREISMWSAWVGFNASHSYGAIFFAAIYLYFALVHPTFLFASPFLLGLGAVFLLAFAVLGQLYWFSVPRRGIFLALAFYAAGLLSLFI